jgi:hypothetical protein
VDPTTFISAFVSQHKESVMNKHGLLIKTGGLAAAAAAHAVFAFGLIAGQPQPEQYLARMSLPLQQPASVRLAAGNTPLRQVAQLCRTPRHEVAASPMPAVDSFRPEQMHKGQTTC